VQFDERLYVASTSIRSVHEILWFPITKINVVTAATPHPVAVYRGSGCCSIAGWTVIACKRVEATSACNRSQQGCILNRGFAWLHFKPRHNLMLFSHTFIHSFSQSLIQSLTHWVTHSLNRLSWQGTRFSVISWQLWRRWKNSLLVGLLNLESSNNK